MLTDFKKIRSLGLKTLQKTRIFMMGWNSLLYVQVLVARFIYLTIPSPSHQPVKFKVLTQARSRQHVITSY